MTKFYTYSQNNSGGSFDFDDDEGVSEYVCVEAHDTNHANAIAEGLGLYFDGYGDCSCCGNRWYSASEYDGADFPHIYGGPLEKNPNKLAWRDPGEPDVYVHYLDGRVEGHSFN